jgi:hypothetical protein
MDSYRIFQYVRVLWIFLFGMVIVLYGVYMLFVFGEVGLYTLGSSFWVMLIGLLLTGVGSIYGKRKLQDPDTFRPKPKAGLGGFITSTTQPAPAKQLQEAPVETKPNPMRPVLQGAEKRIEDDVRRVVSKGIRMASTVATKASTPSTQAGSQGVSQDEVKVIKVLICPKCGSENQEVDKFCFNCGKKLRMSGMKKS